MDLLLQEESLEGRTLPTVPNTQPASPRGAWRERPLRPAEGGRSPLGQLQAAPLFRVTQVDLMAPAFSAGWQAMATLFYPNEPMGAPPFNAASLRPGLQPG